MAVRVPPGSEISGQTFDLARNARSLESSNGLVDAFRGASVYDDACSLSRQAPCYSETDAGRGACDKCPFSLELQIHCALDETPTKKIHVAQKHELRDLMRFSVSNQVVQITRTSVVFA